MHRTIIAPALVLLAALLSACGESPHVVQSTWSQENPHSYEFTQRNICGECAGRRLIRVTVTQDQIAKIVDLETGATLDPSEHAHYRTIDGLFDLMATMGSKPDYVVHAQFDAQYGYPTDVDFTDKQFPQRQDGSWGFKLTDFVAR